METLKKAFDKGLESLTKLFENKAFIEELKSIDVTKLSEEEREIVEMIRGQYEQYLARVVSKYES